MRAGSWHMAILAALILPGAALAAGEEAPLHDIQTCIDHEAARFERVLGWHVGRALEAADFDLWTDWYVEDCGIEAITRCDRGADVITCQAALTEMQKALSAEVRATLPPPGDVQGPQAPVSLYARWHALAHGGSAGPDCAGADNDARWQAWCVTRQANNELRASIVAWQVARYLGAARPGVEAGWARPVAPVRPMARDIEE